MKSMQSPAPFELGSFDRRSGEKAHRRQLREKRCETADRSETSHRLEFFERGCESVFKRPKSSRFELRILRMIVVLMNHSSEVLRQIGSGAKERVIDDELRALIGEIASSEERDLPA